MFHPPESTKAWSPGPYTSLYFPVLYVALYLALYLTLYLTLHSPALSWCNVSSVPPCTRPPHHPTLDFCNPGTKLQAVFYSTVTRNTS